MAQTTRRIVVKDTKQERRQRLIARKRERERIAKHNAEIRKQRQRTREKMTEAIKLFRRQSATAKGIASEVRLAADPAPPRR